MKHLRAAELQDRRVVLIDDVMTFGASMLTAASVLRHDGATHRRNTCQRRSEDAHSPDIMARMFHIVLVAPEIPPNTGNVIRLAANTGCTLHLVEPLGFSMEDKHMRRAGLDYHEYTRVLRHANWQALIDSEQPQPERMFAMTTRGSGSVYDARFEAGDWLVFGSETQGLQPALRDTFAASQRLRLPMLPGQRSLNLSNAVAVTVFEAWRQNGFATTTHITPKSPL